MHGAPTTDDTSHGDFDIKTADKNDYDKGRVREELPSASSWRTSHACRGGPVGALTKQIIRIIPLSLNLKKRILHAYYIKFNVLTYFYSNI